MKNALVLKGDGINCEKETALCCEEAGFNVEVIHVNDLLRKGKTAFEQTHLFVLPGGFSFGDELGSGRLLALKLKHGLDGALNSFIENDGLVLGICNGFQALVLLGLFGKNTFLAPNRSGQFIDKWIGLDVCGPSVFTKDENYYEFPVRHGEGRLLYDAHELDRLGVKRVLQYTADPNGSQEHTAALSAFEGRVLGLMPHPEAFWTQELHPAGSATKVPLGSHFFKNALTFLEMNS